MIFPFELYDRMVAARIQGNGCSQQDVQIELHQSCVQQRNCALSAAASGGIGSRKERHGCTTEQCCTTIGQIRQWEDWEQG